MPRVRLPLSWWPLLWMPLLLWPLLPPANAATAQPDAPVLITQADAVLEPAGAAPLPARSVTLRHRWDAAFPGRDGRAVYTIDLPPRTPGTTNTPRAALLERAGNQVSVEVEGAAPLVLGRTSAHDAAKRAHLVDVPPQATQLRITADMQALRGGGLSPLVVGPRDALEALHARRHIADQVLPAMYTAGLLLIGGLAAGLWWRQRDTLYGCFALASLCGAARPLDRLLPDVPLPWPVWGALLAAAYGSHLALIARFTLLVAERASPTLTRANAALAVAVVLLAVASFAAGVPTYWTGAMVALLAFGAVCCVVVTRAALERRRASVLFVLAAGTVLIAAGLHDLLAVRIGLFGADREPLAQHALFLFVLVMAGIVVARYSGTVAAVKSFNRVLADRVAQRECELTAAFEALRGQREEQAAAAERQRIMRDIHDGVGAQLVGLRSLVRDKHADPAQLAQHVEGALDELRIAVDSMQPSDGDLSTVLATLRYRLQPRLDACAIRIVWDVQPLPMHGALSPQAVLQVQRILLEAFTNVIQHSRATTVTVRARVDDTGPNGLGVRIELRDDGVGLAPRDVAGGHGLSNMRSRAAAIGASVEIGAVPAGGTQLTLRWPSRQAASAMAVTLATPAAAAASAAPAAAPPATAATSVSAPAASSPSLAQ